MGRRGVDLDDNDLGGWGGGVGLIANESAVGRKMIGAAMAAAKKKGVVDGTMVMLGHVDVLASEVMVAGWIDPD